MTMKKSIVRVAAPVAAFALVLSACGGDDNDNGNGDGNGNGDAPADPGDGTDGPTGGTEEPAGEAGGEFSIYQCEPQNLLTGDSSEVCGSSVLEQLYSGLTTVDYETSEAAPMVATEWATEDNITWTLTLRDDFTFTDGEAVTAQTFVDTFDFVSDEANALGGAGFYSNFDSWEAIDDTTLEITLTEPFSPLPVVLSYTAFYPLPSGVTSGEIDTDEFQRAPIGNGRYMMDGEWENNVQIAMVRNEDWPGDDPGLADRIVWRIYDDINVAYNDARAGNLDVTSVPPEQLTAAEGEFGDRYQQFDSSSFTYMGFPLYQEDFQDPNVRHALSMAIDRQAIIDAVFNGALTPATGVIPPVLAQYRGDACNYCDFDPEEANRLYEEAGGPSELTVWFNSGAGHETWTQAVAQQWQQAIPSIENVEFQSLEFAQYLDLLDNDELTGPYRLGWVLSYPSPQYAMEPLYGTDRDSNGFGYSNPDFDNKILEANAALTPEEADALYQEAEDILLEDMPMIPMWYGQQNIVHSENVSGIVADPRTMIRVEQISVND